MAQRRKNKGDLPAEKRDKGDELMNQFTKSKGSTNEANMTAAQKKAYDKFHYGVDSEEEETNEGNAADGMRRRGKKDKGLFGGIKSTHLLLIFLMVGSAFIPMLMMAVEVIGPYINKVVPDMAPMMVSLGLAATPKRRLQSFYEKHNPEKMDEVDKILLKYANDYSKMVKILEAKYHDYGYFLKWEEDGGIVELQRNTYAWIQHNGVKYYTKYIPYPLRQGLSNIYTNMSNLTKKVMKQLDKWTNPKTNVPKPKTTSGGGRKSRRERNFKSRE